MMVIRKLYDNSDLAPSKTIILGLFLMLSIMYFTSHPIVRHKKEPKLNFIFKQILLGNLFFVLLSIMIAMPCSLFLYWSCYHVTEFYLTWFIFITGWLVSGLFGPIRHTGPTFVIMLAIGILLNRIKMEVFHTEIGGDDLKNLISLAEVLIKQSSSSVITLSAGAIGFFSVCMINKLLRRRICHSLLFIGYFFSFSLAVAVASNKIIVSPDYLYGLESSEYNKGPIINFFERVGSILWHENIFSYPLSAPKLQIKYPNPLSKPTSPLFDTVIILQYESLWLGWQGGICQPAPHLTLPPTVRSLHKEILSPTTGGMTVLAEFEMNTGLPIALLKPGIVPYYYLNQQPPSLAHTALQQGYNTTFIHPFLRGFWGRNKAIPALGYQKQIFDEGFSPLQQKGLHISDMALADEILTYIKQQSSPQFIYAVSIQGHGPFNDQRYGKQQIDAACPGTTSNERTILNTYYTGVVDAMASLQHLLTQLDASGKRYLVLAFGDHQPYLMGAEELVLPKPPKRDSTFFIPFMAFTGERTLDMARAYTNASQLYQVSQQTSALLQGLPPSQLPGRLHPVLGMTPDFLLSDYQEQLRDTFMTGHSSP